ncbi:hypothetical protein WDU94_011977 [Cyamophila willieti]
MADDCENNGFISTNCSPLDTNSDDTNVTSGYLEVTLDPSESVRVTLCDGAQIVSNECDNRLNPFLVSNRKLGGLPMDPVYSTLKPFVHQGDKDARKGFVPDEILAGVHQLQNFLRRANDVMGVHAPVFVESFQHRVYQARLKVNRFLNNLTLVTAMFDDFNTKVSAMVRAADVSEYVHNNIRNMDACNVAFERHMEFLHKLGEDIKSEYVLFTRNFTLMHYSVQEQLTRTLHHVHNSVVALSARMEILRILVKQLKILNTGFSSRNTMEIESQKPYTCESKKKSGTIEHIPHNQCHTTLFPT